MTMRTHAVLLLLLLAATVADAQKRYYKGNTHTHCYPKSSDIKDTTYSGGRVVADYKARGYDFLLFTDHVNYWNASELSTPDFTVISGSEAGLSKGYKGHFTAMGTTSNISGSGKTFQQLIDAVVSEGGIPFLNHPRWPTIPLSALQVINEMKNNLSHLEIYNGVTDSPTTFDTSLWDSVLTTGRIMYGVASDDSHKPSNQGKGWICVYASSREQSELVEAIRRGDFYASNGIVLDTIGYAGDHLYVKSANGTSIRFVGRGGQKLSTINAAEGTYLVRGSEGYVRAEIANDQNQTAWTQPMRLTPTHH